MISSLTKFHFIDPQSQFKGYVYVQPFVQYSCIFSNFLDSFHISSALAPYIADGHTYLDFTPKMHEDASHMV